MGKIYGLWLLIALFVGWSIWDLFTTPLTEILNRFLIIGVLFVILLITLFLAYFIDNFRNKKTNSKPVAKLPTAKQVIKNSFNNPGTKLSDLTNSPLGQSMSKFIRDRKINNQ